MVGHTKPFCSELHQAHHRWQHWPRHVGRTLVQHTGLLLKTLLIGCATLAPLATTSAQTTTPARDNLVLLIPDNAALNGWEVKVWTDSAAEEGLRLTPMTDSQFLALGTTAASQIAGLILPDSAHISASDPVIAAVKQYTNLGGKLMLVYDAGALTDTGVYAPTKSRFSDLVGVDYVLYDSLLDRVVGFGPVVGEATVLDRLELPPGKYMAWSAPVTIARSTAPNSKFVPAAKVDAGGTRAMRSYIESRTLKKIDESSSAANKAQSQIIRDALGLASPPVANTTLAPKVTNTTPSLTSGVVRIAAAPQAISGYGFGYLDYFSFVTQGTFSGNTLLSSPDHGLVAGTRTVGSGQVTFVNLPLGYFKAIGTDSALLHGFLKLFARDQVQVPMMSVQPRGIGGLVYNWHVDDKDDLTADAKWILDNTTLLRRGPFSIHFTAGPDTVTLGDNLGMNLNVNTQAQTQFKRIKALGVKHELASHGGWNHDLYGMGVNETNQTTYQPWLELNFAAVERLYGKKTTEYSAPQGNNPTWAIKWLEARGVSGMYFVGDTGAPSVRSWRSGTRLTNKLWSFPLTPFEKYGTFEEFEEFGVTDAASSQWLLNLQNFVVTHRTNRLFYNHPPGARGHVPALTPLMTQADTLQAQNKFRWYTMTQLAAFNERRLATNWTISRSAGISTFKASNAAGVTDMTWLLPINRYGKPSINGGAGTVSSDTANWIVTANSGTSISFVAAEL